MKTTKVTIMCLIYSLIHMKESFASYCVDNAGDRVECKSISCPTSLRNLVGVWTGRDKNATGVEITETESQLLFGHNACMKFGKESVAIMGRRAMSKIKDGTAGASVDVSGVFAIEGGKEGLVSEGATVIRSDELTRWEKNGESFLKLPDGPTEFNKAKVGQLTYFAGKAWTLMSNGKLVGVTQFLLKTEFDPASGFQKEWVYYKPEGKLEKAAGLEINLYEIDSEKLSGSSVDRVLFSVNLGSKNEGGRSMAFENLSNGNLYREERFTVAKGSELYNFKSGSRISPEEFNIKLGEYLKNKEKVVVPPTHH